METDVKNVTMHVGNVNALIDALKKENYMVTPTTEGTYSVILRISAKPMKLKPLGTIYREKGEIITDSADPDCARIIEEANKYT